MQDIIDELDEVLLLCELAVASAREPKIAEAMQRAISLIQEARALLRAEEGAALQSEL